MKSVIGVTSTPQAAVAAADHAEPTAGSSRSDDDELAEDAFEATILRLDGTAFQWLLRQLGE